MHAPLKDEEKQTGQDRNFGNFIEHYRNCKIPFNLHSQVSNIFTT